MTNPRTQTLLTIAGTDPSGGAGIQVDLQVFRDYGFHGASAITSVVWQNTTEVRGFEPMSPEVLQAQLEAIADDLDVAGVKIGMIGHAENAVVIAEAISAWWDTIPVVLDPVLASGTGTSELAVGEMADVIRKRLLAQTDIITPNIPEAERLAECSIETADDLEEAANTLRQLGSKYVLLKTGHLADQADAAKIVDYLTSPTGRLESLESLPRIDEDVRGTGCQLSSAITAELAGGRAMHDAVEGARGYLNRLLREKSERIGRGRPVVIRVEQGPSDAE